jgi:amino acid permease
MLYLSSRLWFNCLVGFKKRDKVWERAHQTGLKMAAIFVPPEIAVFPWLFSTDDETRVFPWFFEFRGLLAFVNYRNNRVNIPRP